MEALVPPGSPLPRADITIQTISAIPAHLCTTIIPTISAAAVRATGEAVQALAVRAALAVDHLVVLAVLAVVGPAGISKTDDQISH